MINDTGQYIDSILLNLPKQTILVEWFQACWSIVRQKIEFEKAKSICWPSDHGSIYWNPNRIIQYSISTIIQTMV